MSLQKRSTFIRATSHINGKRQLQVRLSRISYVFVSGFYITQVESCATVHYTSHGVTFNRLPVVHPIAYSFDHLLAEALSHRFRKY